MRKPGIVWDPTLRFIEITPPENADKDRRRFIIFDRKFVDGESETFKLAQARYDPVRRFIGEKQNAAEIHAGERGRR
jgi:hypothetical protein